MGILRQAEVSRPAGGGWDGGLVCGRAAGGDSRRGSTTSGTVGSRNALGRYAAGRQRNGSGSAVTNLRRASDTPRRNANGENSGHQRLPSQGKAIPSPQNRRVLPWPTAARGHAAGGISRFFVIVPAVMSRREIRLARRRRIAATTAGRPCVRPATVNVSGCGARRKRAASNAAWNTAPHGPNASEIVSLPATWRRCDPRRGLI